MPGGGPTRLNNAGLWQDMYQLMSHWKGYSPVTGFRESLLPRLWFALPALLFLVCNAGSAWGQSTRYVYLSDQRIATVELIDNTSLILNYINLGSSYEVFTAPMVVLLDRDGRVYRAQVYEFEESKDPTVKYGVTELIKPGEFKGFLVRGQFTFQAEPSRALLQISSRILDMAPVSEKEFDLFASRVARLELGDPDRKLALQRVGFDRGFGEMLFTGTPEAAELEKFFPDDNLLAPQILSSPPPRLPGDFEHLPEPVQVRVRLFVSQVGGTSNFEVVNGVEPTLDRMAVETVRNSWTFLPAVSNNQVVATEVTLLVTFVRSE